MRLPKLSLPAVLWLLGAVTFVGIMVDRANTPVLSQEAFVSLLADCGASGKPVEEAVRAMNISERVWGRTVSRHASNPQVAEELETRLARLPEAAPTVFVR